MRIVRNAASPDTALPRYQGRPRASEMARQKAIEKSKLAYFMLTCGHLTNYEEQELNEAFRLLETDLGPLWYCCDTCYGLGLPQWHKRAPIKREILPEEPPFLLIG